MVYQTKLSNITTDEILLLDKEVNRVPLVEIIVWIIFLAIVFFGVVINLFVCITVARKRAMQTPVNVILMNLAIADMILCVFSVILDPLYETAAHILLGKLTCRFIVSTNALSKYFTAIAIAAPLVIYSFYRQLDARKCGFLIFVFWLFAIICAIVPGFNADIYVEKTINKAFCVEIWTVTAYNGHQDHFERFNIFIQLGLPVLVTAGCIITHKVVNKRFISGNPLHRMLLMMIIIHLLLWTPEVALWYRLYVYNTYIQLFYHLHYLARYLALFSIFYKPILYIKYDSQFHKEFKALILCSKSSEAEDYALHSNDAI